MIPQLAIAGAGIGLAGLQGLLGNKAQKKATNQQLAALAEQNRLIQEGYGRAEALMAPAAQYKPALGQLQALLGLNGGQAQQDAYGAFRDTPGYQFSLDQGNTSMNRSAAARGGALSGRTLVDAQKLGQGLADQNFGDYYGRLSSLFGTQLGAASDLAGGYRGEGSQLGSLAQLMGQVRADGTMGRANNWSTMLNGMGKSMAYGMGAFNDPTRSTFGNGVY